MADLTVKGLIEIVLKGGEIPKDVRKDVAQLGNSLREGQVPLANFTSGLTRLAGAFGITLGAGAVINFLRQSFVEFANTERQVNALNQQIRALGQSEKFTADKVRELIGAISQQYGIVDDELVPAMNRLVLGLGDVDAAQRALDISARFAANGFGDVRSNAEALSLAIQSGTSRSLRAFGIATEDAAGNAITLEQGIQRVTDKYATLAPKIDDAKTKLDEFKLAMDQFGDVSGKAVDVALTGILNVDDAIGDAINGIVASLSKLDAATGGRLGIGLPLEAYLQQVDGIKSIESGAKGAADAIRDIGSAVDSITGRSTVVSPLALPGQDPLLQLAQVKIANQKAAEEKQKADEKAQKDAEKVAADALALQESFQSSVEDIYADDVTAYRKALADKQEALNDSLIGLLAATSAKAEKQSALDIESANALAEAQIALAEDNLAEQGRIELEAFDRTAIEKQTRALAQGLSTVELTNSVEAQRFAIVRKYAKAQLAIQEAKAKSEKDLAYGTAAAAAGALAQLFPQFKAFAYAEIIINTIRAVQQVMADETIPSYWLKVAIAATVAAQGLANARRVASTNVGAGFDDPAQDKMAYMGGKRWAGDMVREYTRGWASGMRESIAVNVAAPIVGGPNVSVAGVEGSGLTVHFHGPVVGSERRVARRLYRLVQKGRVADKGRAAF